RFNRLSRLHSFRGAESQNPLHVRKQVRSSGFTREYRRSATVQSTYAIFRWTYLRQGRNSRVLSTTADFYPLPGLRPLWRQGATLAYNPSRRLFWVRTSDGNKVGLATTSGDFLLPLRYDDIFPGQFDNADDPVGV